MRRLITWVLLLTSLDAQEAAASAGVDAVVDLGMLAVGAHVEASFRVLWSDARLVGVEAVVQLPPGVRALRVTTEVVGTGAGTVVEYTVDTSTARTIDAPCTVRCGEATSTAPFRAKIVAVPPGSARVLVATTPFQADASADTDVFEGWRRLVAAANLEIDHRLVRAGRATFDLTALRRVEIVLAAEDALLALDDLQVARLHGFVAGGGRLIVCANAFFVGAVRGANRLAEAFDLAIADREQARDLWRVDQVGLARHALTVGIESITAERPSPLVVPQAPGVVTLATFTTPSEQPFVAMATTPSGGEIVVIGESLWWRAAEKSPGFARLLRNLLQRVPRLH